MATIVLAWELGGGLGHVLGLSPLAARLRQRGHQVIAVLRDLSAAHKAFDGAEVCVLQAPFKHERMRQIEPTCTFAHVLHNIGFGVREELASMVGAWRRLFDWLKPDLIVFDHSPTALLAARGLAARRVVIGTGFCCPPNVTPLPNLRTWLKPNIEQLLAHEAQVLANINAVLGYRNQPPVERVIQLYHPLDEEFLLTFPELDPYPQRSGARYWGTMPTPSAGLAPDWPSGDGQRIFGYLKPFPALPHLLDALCRLPNPVLLVIDALDSKLRQRFARPNLQCAAGLVNITQAARECDLAILNGTHTTTADMLLAGKPILQIPIFLEQGLNSMAAARLGAAVHTSATHPQQIVGGLQSMLASGKYAAAAQAFASRHVEHNAVSQLEKLIDRAEELAAGHKPTTKHK